MNWNNKHKWTYPDLESTRRPVVYLEEIPILSFSNLPKLPKDEVQRIQSENDSDFEADLTLLSISINKN